MQSIHQDRMIIKRRKYMEVVCLDMEGVLVPEIWIAFSEATGIPELKRTTRDEPDYDKLMRFRIGILKEHGLGLKEIQDTIATIDPFPGAGEFLDELLHQQVGHALDYQNLLVKPGRTDT